MELLWVNIRWYLSTRQENKDQWINQGDGTQMLNLQDYFHDR